MTYNIDEGLGQNHYNCPVVAYYPEVLAGNCPELAGTRFIYDYVGIHRPKDFVRKMHGILGKYFSGISRDEVREASDAAYAEYAHHMLDPVGRQEVLSSVHRLNREKGITVVLITHHMNEAEDADRVIVMRSDGTALLIASGQATLFLP